MSESVRFAHEACSVCRGFGAYGLGPPARPQINGFDERRCAAHLWPEWGAARTPGAASPPQPQVALQRPAAQVDLFGGAR